MRASDKAYQTLLDEIVEGSLPPGAVLAEVEQSLLVASKHLDYLFDGLQLAAHRVVRPRLQRHRQPALLGALPGRQGARVIYLQPAGFGLWQGRGSQRFPGPARGHKKTCTRCALRGVSPASGTRPCPRSGR